VQLADQVLAQGSSDCGKAAGTVTLITQSDIDSISACTTIFGTLFISLQSAAFESTDNSSPASPAVFTLPSNLQSIGGALSITVEDAEAATTTLVAPNLQQVGYGNESSDSAISIQGPRGETWNLTNTSFPALTSVGGSFSYQTSPLLTAVTGFRVLATISNVQAGELFVNGSFASVQFPALTSVSGEILIQTTNPSFKCPSNITPKLVTFPNCVVCQDYVDTPNNMACAAQSQSTVGNTPSITNTAGTNTAGTTTPTAAGKTSEASDFNRAGYQL
jgi:hypothetical protein